MNDTDRATREASQDRPFYGQPFWWLAFALALVMVPVMGYMVRSGMTWDDIHPAINALLNACGTVFMVTGFIAVKRRNIALHKRCMGAAVIASLLFLVSYLIRYRISGTHRYPGDGVDKAIYLAILVSHMILAAVSMPMVLRTAYLALRGRIARHRRIARITLPIWLYVSVTGVIVYVMLYPLAKVLYGA